LRRLGAVGRRLPMPSPIDAPPEPLPPPQQHEAAGEVPPLEPPVTYDITDDVPRFEDEIEAEIKERRKKEHPKPPPPQPAAWSPYGRVSRRRATWDRLLLVVEVLSVLGIIAVLAVGGYLLVIESDKIEALNQKSASMQREAAAIGVFITLEEPSGDMRTEAVGAGFYHSPGWNKAYPRVQLFTISELLRGAEVKMPPEHGTFRLAQKVRQPQAAQGQLELLPVAREEPEAGE